MDSFQSVIEVGDIQQAARVIAPYIYLTPVVPSELISEKLDCQVAFKAENLQHIGAFKARGAINAVMTLDESAAARGVVTHSSGNHAAALARAASLRKIDAYVVMPKNASERKIAAVRRFGIEPIFSEPSTESREETARRVLEETGATMIHPYDMPAVMSGQGTVGLEILQQVDQLDAILVPLGGGGLLAGVLTAVKAIKPEVAVIAVEPENANDAARGLLLGQRQMPTRYDTIADGLRTAVGVNTFPIIQHWLDEILLVGEDQIRKATRDLAEDLRLVVEPSGAVTFAAIKQYASRFRGLRVVAVISGGNLSFGECRMGRTAPEGRSHQS